MLVFSNLFFGIFFSSDPVELASRGGKDGTQGSPHGSLVVGGQRTAETQGFLGQVVIGDHHLGNPTGSLN